MRLTRRPRLSSRQPMEAAARPLPKLDTTPPVTKTYFADMDATSLLDCCDWTYRVGTFKYGRNWNPMKAENWDGLIMSGPAPAENGLFSVGWRTQVRRWVPNRLAAQEPQGQ